LPFSSSRSSTWCFSAIRSSSVLAPLVSIASTRFQRGSESNFWIAAATAGSDDAATREA
jgi:hypothetical protein